MEHQFSASCEARQAGHGVTWGWAEGMGPAQEVGSESVASVIVQKLQGEWPETWQGFGTLDRQFLHVARARFWHDGAKGLPESLCRF